MDNIPLTHISCNMVHIYIEYLAVDCFNMFSFQLVLSLYLCIFECPKYRFEFMLWKFEIELIFAS